MLCFCPKRNEEVNPWEHDIDFSMLHPGMHHYWTIFKHLLSLSLFSEACCSLMQVMKSWRKCWCTSGSTPSLRWPTSQLGLFVCSLANAFSVNTVFPHTPPSCPTEALYNYGHRAVVVPMVLLDYCNNCMLTLACL